MTYAIKKRRPFLTFINIISVIYFLAFAAVAIALTVGSFLGFLPWMKLEIMLVTGAVDLGPALQVGLTMLAVLFLGLIPSSMRVLSLENSHRDFMITMEDVHKAYVLAHAEDRAGIFNMSSEFDSVRERIDFMRNHPELDKLQPEVLEVASQMSHISRDLADVYSDEKVQRARAVLRQRQVELEQFNDQLFDARKRSDEIQRWSEQLDSETNIARQQLAVLKSDLGELLPALGLQLTAASPESADMTDIDQFAVGTLDDDPTNVVAMAGKPAGSTAAE